VMGKADTDDWQTDQRWAYLRVNQGLLDSIHFIRDHAQATDRMQDSQNDVYYVVESLCQTRAYVGWPVVGSYTARDPGDVIFKQRVAEMSRWKQMKTIDEILRDARDHQIRWFLLHPETVIDWPPAILSHPCFESMGYRVYDMSKFPSVPNARREKQPLLSGGSATIAR
jgi:hypothetical protein